MDKDRLDEAAPDQADGAAAPVDTSSAEAEAKREEVSDRVREHYQASKDEADRKPKDWLREPGVLDDWNDRRAI